MAELNAEIDKAVAELTEKAGKKAETVVEDKTTETTQQEDDEQQEIVDDKQTQQQEEDDLSDEEIKETKALYKLLKDPNTAKVTITALANHLGLFEAETPKEVKAAKKEIIDLVKEGLGPEYQFLADKMGKIFENVLHQERSEREAQFLQIEQQKIASDTESVLAKLSKETNGDSKRLESKMANLADQFPKGKDISIEQYVRGLYTMASARGTVNKANLADKIRRNANDVTGRINSGGSPGTNSLPDKKMNINEAVNWAAKQLEQGKK